MTSSAEGAPLATLQPPRDVRVTVPLNVRSGPSARSTRVARLQPGQVQRIDAVVAGDPFLDRLAWYRIAGSGQFIWSGGAELLEPDSPPAATATTAAGAPQVSRRSNGTILPLDAETIAALFGAFEFDAIGSTGAVRIVRPVDWESKHIEIFDHELLRAVSRHSPPVHKLAHPFLRRALDAIAAAGLGDLILTFDGSFVPRFKNWDPASGRLSAHSWGIAIDINARFNSARSQPALPGQRGNLRPLVEHFNAHGFAWGGHFSSPVDGMHFELARRDLQP